MNNGWIIEDNSLNSEDLLKNESIFNVSNGYLGIRGNFEEGYKKSYKTIKSTLINGFYDIVPIIYGEKAYGFPEVMEKNVNITDVQEVEIFLGDEKFNLFEGEVIKFERYVDLKKGVYVRNIHWISNKGKEIKLKIERIASFNILELFIIKYSIEKINFEENIKIVSKINGNIRNFADEDDPRVGNESIKLLKVKEIVRNKENFIVTSETQSSKKVINVSVCNYSKNAIKKEHTIEKEKVEETLILQGKQVEFIKFNVFTDSIRYDNYKEKGNEILEDCKRKGVKYFFEKQVEYLEEFWGKSDIKIEGDKELQGGIRYNIYQLLQSVGKDMFSNMCAKGLSGEGYEGHYFWDTEIYIAPFFMLTNPKLAKNLLKYRYNILECAKQRALELGHSKGAAYPWRTIAGRECSAYFPAGTAQYHINGDIAYSYIQYLLITGDEKFLEEFGAEVIFETARIWIEIGHFYGNEFRIDAVTGPDEYTAIVNNNFYTNCVAKYNLMWAVKIYRLLEEKNSGFLINLRKKIKLTEEEIMIFEKANEKMRLPKSEEYDIDLQDDNFINRKVWDFKNTPKDKYPLLLNYHPLTIYRHQVLKQADVVLAHFLLEEFTDKERIKNSYKFYEKLTTHDSSLSYAIHSIMGSKLGESEQAYEYLMKTAKLDLDNQHNNTKDGLHLANMGGTWMSLVYGFAGIRIKEKYIEINPKLPSKIKGLDFKIMYMGSELEIKIEKKLFKIKNNGKERIIIKYKNTKYDLNNELKFS